MESKSKNLRSGFTTGACAAAAAKAATLFLLRNDSRIEEVEIPFPDERRVKFKVQNSEFRVEGTKRIARASVIKDAGDDPDITNGAEIVATVQRSESGAINQQSEIVINGGRGVGRVTKPGLPIPVGEPAINPVPRRMIREAVMEAVSEFGDLSSECGVKNPQFAIANLPLEVTISVPAGEELAKKTLNHRLGIVGGISILGTTGIVKPLSEAAWTATITASFDVAKALGREEIVLSTGRTSEKAHQNKYGLPEDCYAMMGDYTEFSLREAAKHGFSKVHLCAQWAKMIKIAMATPQTHVRHGALEAETAVEFLNGLGLDIPRDRPFNTVREIYDHIRSIFHEPRSAFVAVCDAARGYCLRETGGVPVSVHLVSYEGEIVAESE